MSGPLADVIGPLADMSGPLSGRRVVLVINDVRWFFSHRQALGERLRDMGAEVIVAAPPHELASGVESAGFRFEPVGVHRGFRGLRSEFLGILSLFRLYRSTRPALVHHVTVKPVLYGSLAARAARVPAVVNLVAGMGYLFMGRGWWGRLRRGGARLAYRWALGGRNRWLIVQNPEDRSDFVDNRLVRAERVCLIRGSGVDPAEFMPSEEPPGPVAMVLPGRMIEDKGVRDFVEAAKLLRDRGRDYRFVLAGDVDPANPTSIPPTQLEHWQRQGLVEWRGHVSDMPALLRDSHVVVLPSYREGLPKALLEAGASGRPAVTTDVPGCREVVTHEVNGLLVPPGDPSVLAEAMDRLGQSAALRRAMGARGREVVIASFTSARVVDQTLEVYHRALAGRTAA